MSVLDWMTKNKATETSTQQVWSLIHEMLPDADHSDWGIVHSLLENHKRTSIFKIDACVCGRIAYFDPVHEELSDYKYADLEECPIIDCVDENGHRNKRYVVNDQGVLEPRNYFYYFPVAVWLEDLFKRTDLVQYLYNDLPPTQFSSGHIRCSTGFQTKVTNNPNINSDRRHQAVTGSSDGVPLFRDKNSLSAWPFVLKSAMLPDGLINEMCYAHLLALTSSSHLSADDGSPVQVQRSETFGSCKSAMYICLNII